MQMKQGLKDVKSGAGMRVGLSWDLNPGRLASVTDVKTVPPCPLSSWVSVPWCCLLERVRVPQVEV